MSLNLPQSAKLPKLPDEIAAYLERSGLLSDGAHAFPLTGDASDRRYYRVLKRNGDSLVLALHASPFDYEKLPFVNVARLLELARLPVPAILGHAGDLGVLALEDLGDVTLQAHLGVATPVEHQALYRQAVRLIAKLQQRGSKLESPEFLPYGIAFDVEKLTWELNFFVRHFVEAYRGTQLEAAEREALGDEWTAIVEELSSEPRVLCHRDYHSRNLMLKGERLYMIDFQDARMGPDTYDLASLLRDAYTDLAEDTVEDLIAYFLALKREPGEQPSEEPDHLLQEFRRRFDLMSLQRNLKALGTFGYQTVARQNPVYIQYMPRTLQHVRTNLARYARFGRLHELLAAHLPELR